MRRGKKKYGKIEMPYEEPKRVVINVGTKGIPVEIPQYEPVEKEKEPIKKSK